MIIKPKGIIRYYLATKVLIGNLPVLGRVKMITGYTRDHLVYIWIHTNMHIMHLIKNSEGLHVTVLPYRQKFWLKINPATHALVKYKGINIPPMRVYRG